ncbi:MAG: uracil-DNA glycosylase [Candidatus Saccharibacteria bacterium]|nr:uracil-DNA glycosylase [Candidatus Saccharibacteria bacterium]
MVNATAKQVALNALRDEIVAQGICRELASQANRLVMGDGNLDAQIVFIGEAPGKKEDEQGVPFVGASGKFLNQMLESVGLERTDVYITNIVKYRPPANRDPSSAEKSEFWPYLLRQLEIIKPAVVITLGRHAMNCFLPATQIADVHGQITDIAAGGLAIKLLPLYHPAAALYNGSMRQTLLDDFQTVKQLL